ncbi:MAG TPA: hypothetical protein VFP37_11565 [Steroidobacteraceae bacterium]|nr:hypothetical protein [Steroidobacteraceae bacterium]
MNSLAVLAFTTRRGFVPGVFDDLETHYMSNFTEPPVNVAHLPDAANHNPDPEYIRSLIERANLTHRAAARLVGIDERSLRYQLKGEKVIPYSTQYCLEVLARGGVADQPQSGTIWYRSDQRPLRDEDVGRLVVARVVGDLVLGRVKRDGFGITVEVSARGVDGRMVGARSIAEYTLVDDEPAK